MKTVIIRKGVIILAGEISINTDMVLLTATNITGINDNIRDGFSDVEDALSSLNTNWDGTASENAFTQFNAIKDAFCDNRYNVVANYVTFLQQQIDAGYVGVENINNKLAEAFK